ncbi:P-loop containing nucleoside triphosphate hydrolase protein [Calycina marina]|uniref:Cell division control protein n=1 Tax=Calycina marina TaxID=1763456 RepID=A0A9P8CJ15_9HELO|nr:P-loop containing nucleoside triphosphate hydrolase protein [Calycina marina]
MPSTVLGKRTRSSTNSASIFESLPPSAKRQARAEIFEDEYENPFISRISRDGSQDVESVDIDEDAKVIKRPTRPTPANHGAAESRTPHSGSRKHIDITKNNKENSIRVQNPTPKTPRHRDALSKQVPVTPRHRVLVAGKSLTPRAPRTPVTPGGSIATIYGKARALFTRSNEPGRLVGREAERDELTSFIQSRVEKTAGGCTYVSGPPGTGKSAMVHELTSEFETTATLKKTYINCMSIKSSKDLYAALRDVFCEDMEIVEGDEVKTLQKLFITKKGNSAYLITLDEIDHILTLDLEILYKLFEWSLQKNSRLVLIGIANALDLTDRFLPRLKSRNLKPELLPFLPYDANQIKTVITSRLKTLIPVNSATPDFVPFLHPMAIEICSRKVANHSGDLRRAFDICRRAIDLIETETKQKHEHALNEQAILSPSKQPLQENVNLALPASPSRKLQNMTLAKSLATLTIETAPRATVGHVNKITLATFSNGANQRLKSLNLQQKAALCALVALEKRKREIASNVGSTPSKSRNSAPTVKALYDVYCMLCKRDSILHPLTSTEFRDVVGSLETLSLVGAVDGKNGSFVGMSTLARRNKKFGSGPGVGDEKRVSSCVAEKEVAQAVEGLGAGILKNILSGEGLE